MFFILFFFECVLLIISKLKKNSSKEKMFPDIILFHIRAAGVPQFHICLQLGLTTKKRTEVLLKLL